MKQSVVCCSADVMGGTAVFYGTRVPVQTLLDYLEAGETVDDFLEGFRSVTREQVIAFLEEAKDRHVRDVLAEAIAEAKREARADGLKDEEIDAELDEWRAERRA